MDHTDNDPKGLIREAYRIEGITPGECRSVFLDWAISLKPDENPRPAIVALLAQYGGVDEAHPMNAVLKAGLADQPTAKRRGGRRGRIAGQD